MTDHATTKKNFFLLRSYLHLRKYLTNINRNVVFQILNYLSMTWMTLVIGWFTKNAVK